MSSIAAHHSFAVLAIEMRLEPLPTSVIVPVYMRRAQSRSCDPRHVVGLKHERQSVGLQLLGLFIGLLDGLLVSAGVRSMWRHAQMQASTCTHQLSFSQRRSWPPAAVRTGIYLYIHKCVQIHGYIPVHTSEVAAQNAVPIKQSVVAKLKCT